MNLLSVLLFAPKIGGGGGGPLDPPLKLMTFCAKERFRCVLTKKPMTLPTLYALQLFFKILLSNSK